MKKLLLALFALTLLVAFTAPSYAADFKFSGFFRVRGSSENVNKDGNDDADDKEAYLDALIRPRFTMKSGAVTAVWEPEFQSANGGFTSAGRQTVGVNRWVIDYAIPGSALRMRWGRTDYFSPDKEIYDSGGRHREPGVAVYGKLSKNVSLSLFHTKAAEDGSSANADLSDYYGGLSIKVAPTLTLTPWAANSRSGKDNGYNYSFLGLHAKTKAGMLNINASGVFQSGDIDDSTELSAWALLLRTSASFGKLKLMGNLTMLSGDDTAGDNEEGRFKTPQLGGSGWFIGSHIMSSRRWTTFGNNIRDVALQSRMNGAVVIEGLADYKVSKTLTLGGGVSLYSAAESSMDAGTDDAKDFGTELNVALKWKIHSNLELRAVAAMLMRGDYGKAADADTPDDGWAAGWTIRHIF